MYLLIGPKWCWECYEDFWKSDKSLKEREEGGEEEEEGKKTQTARDGEDKFNRFMRLGD